jgi:hypothetical protein
MGYTEIGVDAIADTGLIPNISPDGMQGWLTSLGEPPPGPAGDLAELLVTRYDPLKMLALANVELYSRPAPRLTALPGSARYTSCMHYSCPTSLGSPRYERSSTHSARDRSCCKRAAGRSVGLGQNRPGARVESAGSKVGPADVPTLMPCLPHSAEPQWHIRHGVFSRLLTFTARRPLPARE